MKVNKSSLFWGILLIGFGAFALAQSMGYVTTQSPTVWTFIFGGLSVIAFIFYFVDGVKSWGWLFPAGVFGGVAVTIALAANNVDGAGIGSPIFFGLLIPFAAAYLTDRSRNWWALIPGGVMLFLAFTTLSVDTIGGEWIGSLFLFMIGLGFFVVYMNNRTRNWALLVAYIMFVLSLAPIMATNGEITAYYGSVFLFAVALPFFVVYFRSTENWWAIIPAGVMTVLALIAGLAIAGLVEGEIGSAYANAILMGGLAATFAVVWLRHAKSWAKVVTFVLAALAVASVFFGTYTEIFWPVAIILVGIYLLYTAMRPRTAHP